jgi:RNA polymerase sigma factor (sigma-70 family)
MAFMSESVERELVARWAAGAEHCHERLARAQLTYVRHWARKYADRHPAVDVDDLASEGALGLAEAMRRFDPARGMRLATFTLPYIRGRQMALCRRVARDARVLASGHMLDVADETPIPVHEARVCERALASLDAEEAYVIRALYMRDREATLASVGAELGRSREYVRLVRLRALAIMRSAVGAQ